MGHAESNFAFWQGVETSPCLYLMRPDWHVAFRGGLEHARRLNDYLERVVT